MNVMVKATLNIKETSFIEFHRVSSDFHRSFIDETPSGFSYSYMFLLSFIDETPEFHHEFHHPHFFGFQEQSHISASGAPDSCQMHASRKREFLEELIRNPASAEHSNRPRLLTIANNSHIACVHPTTKQVRSICKEMSTQCCGCVLNLLLLQS